MSDAQTTRSAVLVTCSMARDLDLFALLAASIDAHVDASITHRVVVPGSDMPAFRRFASPRREIIAQEDLLPPMWKAPAVLKRLAVFKSSFRRPLYITSRFAVVRGWMLQQYLKIDMARRATEAAVMHVDSDVAFFRPFDADCAFDGDRVRFFRVEGSTANPMHDTWVASSAQFLGIKVPTGYEAHYVENCVMWSSDVTRAMVNRVETTLGRPIQEAIFASKSMSEYYLYGLYADFLHDGSQQVAENVSFCNSFWPKEDSNLGCLDTLEAGLETKHRAIAVQSTNPISVDKRARLYAHFEGL